MKKITQSVIIIIAVLALLPIQVEAQNSAVKKGETFLFKGVLSDTLFATSESIHVEVLENGQNTDVSFGQQFEVPLPLDTLWNICFSDNTKEKCYEIIYTGVDSIFTQKIGSDIESQLLFDDTQEDITLEVATDVVTPPELDDEEESDLEGDVTQAINKRTKLRKTVVRLRKRPKRALGKTTISAKSIKRMPSLAEADVIKSIQALPGVVASSDFSSKLYVRGAGADQNLFLFDNAVVYSPIHLFGLFSTFLVEGIDEVNFYKGGFSPKYGNRLSSVVDIKSRKGGNDSTNSYLEGSSLKISTFATQIHTEGRHGKFRWLLGGRATYLKEMLEFFNYIGATDIELDYRFWDIQGSFNYEFSPGQNLMFSLYTGNDNLDFGPLLATWGNDIYAINYEHKNIASDLDLQLTASWSTFSQEYEFENISRFENNISSKGLRNYKATVTYSGMSNNVVVTGLESQTIETAFIQELLFLDNDPDSTTENDTTEQTTTQESADNNLFDFWLHSGYVSDAFSWGDITVTPGIRINYHSNLERFYFEPRISLQYRLPAQQVLDFHLGHYKQFVNSLQFSDQENINELYYPTKKTKYREMRPSESDMLSIGYSNPKMFDVLDLTVETYYKVFRNLYVFDLNNAPTEVKQDAAADLGDFFTMGEGYSYGFELLLRKDEGTIFGGVSYSYGRSVLQDLAESATSAQKDSASYPANWDQSHSIKFDMGINWRGVDGIWGADPKNMYVRSSFAVKLASGLPYPAVAGYMPSHLIDQGSGWNPGGPPIVFDDGISSPRAGRNRERYPWYQRIDLKLFNIGREGKWSLSYSIINVLNTENIWFYTYDTTKNPIARDTQTQLPFLPVMINYEYYF